MVAKLSQRGDELVLVIDPDIARRLGIGAGTDLNLSTQGDVLIVARVRDEARAKKFEAAVAKVNDRYAEMFKRLAE